MRYLYFVEDWGFYSGDMVTKAALLRLLLLGEPLDTAEKWKTALEKGEEEGALQQEEKMEELRTAVENIVPNLPDYSAVGPQLRALMTICASADSMVIGWLQRSDLSRQFRRWVLQDWLTCCPVTLADCEIALQWKHALFVAAVHETERELKRTLLERLAAVDAELETRWPAKDERVETATRLDSVEELLDFYFANAERLATCSLLCAAKLHALAVKTKRSAEELAECDDVVVRLRSALELKPMLFKPLLQHAVALKILPPDALLRT